MIVDIQRRLRTVGKIRMGQKGDRGQPQRLTNWRITSHDARALAIASTIYGGTVTQWEDPKHEGQYELFTESPELRIVLAREVKPSQWYEEWSAGGCQHRCDGETDEITGAACTCDPEARKCKLTTRVSVFLPELPALGVWMLESHGYYAATELMGAVEMVYGLEDQHAARLPMLIAIEPRTTVKDGQTRKYVVPVLRLPESLAALLSGRSSLSLAEMASRALLDDNVSGTIGAQPNAGALPAAPEPSEEETPVQAAKRRGEQASEEVRAGRARKTAQPHTEPAAPEEQPTSKPDVGGMWTGPGQCPDCHCPPGHKHASKCATRTAGSATQAAVDATAPAVAPAVPADDSDPFGDI